MNEITPTPNPYSQTKKLKIFQKLIFLFVMVFRENSFKGSGLATLSFNRYTMTQRLLGEKLNDTACILCFKITPILTLTHNSKNKKNFSILIFLFVMIF